jgi:hypothetical protein
MDWINYKTIASEAERIQAAIEAAEDNAQLSLIPDDHENIRGEQYYK